VEIPRISAAFLFLESARIIISVSDGSGSENVRARSVSDGSGSENVRARSVGDGSGSENVRARSVSDGSCRTTNGCQNSVWIADLIWRDPSLTLRALTSSCRLAGPVAYAPGF